MSNKIKVKKHSETYSCGCTDYKEEDVICIVWGVEDVKMRIDELKAILPENDYDKLTEEDAKEILWRTKSKHDATIGINWDVIDFWIDEHKNEKKEEEK